MFTVKDYKSKILQMHPRYGCPFRLNAIEDNNKIVISCLGLNSQGKLDSGLPEIMKNNIVDYLKEYKTLGDYIELRSGKIYNLSFEVDVFVDKNYTTSDVVKTVINKVKDYMSVQNHDMGEEIFIGDLEKEINLLDGVVSLIDLRVYAIYGGNYSSITLPNACETVIEVKMNLRSLIHFMNERLCTRAQWEIRQMALLMKRCIEEQYPELAKYLVPKCEVHEGMPFCTEHSTCGRHPLLKDIYSKFIEVEDLIYDLNSGTFTDEEFCDKFWEYFCRKTTPKEQ